LLLSDESVSTELSGIPGKLRWPVVLDGHLKLAVALFPAPSLAVQSTAVSPSRNPWGAAGEHLRVTGPSTKSTAETG
jgi:hypothetical protein